MYESITTSISSRTSLMITKSVLTPAAALCLLFSSLFALPQGPTTGRIEGTIRDPNGAVVPQAEIKIVNTTTGTESISRTNDAGHYVVSLLPPGMYRVTVTASGFAAQPLGPVVVSVT